MISNGTIVSGGKQVPEIGVVVVAVICFVVFIISPVRRMGDSKYCLLVSQSLLERGRFDVGEYELLTSQQGKDDPVFKNPISVRKGIPYQLERRNKRLYYFFPPGTSVLSLPFVSIAVPLKRTPAVDGVYSARNERQLQAIIGAALMCILSGVLYLCSRCVLSRWWSIIMTIAGAFGTMIWSTASRGLPSHSWGILLLMVVLYCFFRSRDAMKNTAFVQVAVATLLSWMYFVRPTFAISIVGISVLYIFLIRRLPFAFFCTGAAWLGMFLWYSDSLFGQWLPGYFLPGRVNVSLGWRFWEALWGVLVSPSRGIIVFIPTILGSAYLLVRYRRFVSDHLFVIVSILVITAHLLLISSFRQWWGGYSYGPRLFIDVLPWFFVLGILSLKAWQDAWGSGQIRVWQRRMESLVLISTLIWAVFVHGMGAWNEEVWKWNEQPNDIDTNTNRLWDWRTPQFGEVWKR